MTDEWVKGHTSFLAQLCSCNPSASTSSTLFFSTGDTGPGAHPRDDFMLSL